MSLRTAIRDMLAGGDPAALRDVPADEVAQALTNYADTASLTEADALAPIVTRASHVPFDEDIDGDLGAPLVDVHADLASLASVESSTIDDEGDAPDPGHGIDDPAGNESAPEGADSDVDAPDGHDDADDAVVDQADDDHADVADSTDVDPDGWFDADPIETVPAAVGLDHAIADDASMADDAMAFGTGTTDASPDLETLVASDEVDPAFEARLEAPLDPTFESSPMFDDGAIDADVINEPVADDAEFDPGSIDVDVEVDDGPVDDSFGDVEFEL